MHRSLSARTRFSLVLLASQMAISSAFGAQLGSSCTLMEGKAQAEVEGFRPDLRLPIASVSKVATAFWSIGEKGIDYRFRTNFHVTPVGQAPTAELDNGDVIYLPKKIAVPSPRPNGAQDAVPQASVSAQNNALAALSEEPLLENSKIQFKADAYDVHIEGSRDPYFGRESLHYAISELSRRGITKIRTLSFDENFKFYWDVNSSDIAMKYFAQVSGQTPYEALIEILPARQLTRDWNQSLSYFKGRGISLLEKPQFEVQELRYVQRREYRSTGLTRLFSMKSSPLPTLLKEMNRNSNNHAAAQIFEHLGGWKAFHEYTKKRLGFDDLDVRFLNGSGDSIMRANGKFYNEASCSAMLKMLRALREDLRAKGKDLQDVMAVSGGDDSSTTSRIYNGPAVDHALIAKTGTVDPDITLAGILHTRQGDVYFMLNYRTGGKNPGAIAADQGDARRRIKADVLSLMQKYQGADPVKFSPPKFIGFDGKFPMTEAEPISSRY